MKRIYLPGFSVKMCNLQDQKNAKRMAIFRVPSYLTKCQMKSYFEMIYGKKVDKVRTIQQQGKMKRARRKYPYKTSNHKKAILFFK